jgi:hypothetical protein
VSIEAPIFLSRPRLLIAPFLKVRLGAVRKKDPPCGFEAGAGFVEGQCGAGRALAWAATWIEPAAPLPLRHGVRVADRAHQRADVHIAIMDVPAFLADVRIEAAGEDRHTPLKPGGAAGTIRYGLGLSRAPYARAIMNSLGADDQDRTEKAINGTVGKKVNVPVA